MPRYRPPQGPDVRAAAARLAAVERHHSDNPGLVAAARRDLMIAQAAVQIEQASALLRQVALT